MSRIRTIKPEFFRSRSLARCDRDARLTFAGLWTEADDHGRGIADQRILKGALWALDDDVTHQHVSAHLDVLVETGHIRLYEVDGETYYEIVNWTDHQASAYRRGEPKHPAPDTYLDDGSHDDVQESAGSTGDRAGREGNREQGREQPLARPADADEPKTWEDDPEFVSWWEKFKATVHGRAPTGAPSRAWKPWKRLTIDAKREAYRALEVYGALLSALDHGRKPNDPHPNQHGSTWLNDRRWESVADELQAVQAKTRPQAVDRPTCGDCGQYLDQHRDKVCRQVSAA